MFESPFVAGLIVALLLPWLFGSVWMFYLLTRSGHWNYAVVIGHGYIAGVFITTLLVRVCAALGLVLHFWTLAAILSVLSIVGIILIRQQGFETRIQTAGRSSALWQKTVIALLLSLLLIRYFTIAQELYLRPLYAWDSWMNWYPKAAVWYHYKAIVPYVSPDAWLTQAAGDQAYTLGNYRAWRYPSTVPLIQLWNMLGAGTDYHPAMYIPWMIAVLMLGLALFGHLRLAGASIIVAVGASYCMLSLPYFNVHTALVGYADIWLAAAFGLAGFALHEWQKSRHWSYCVLALVMALLCIQLKVPGTVMGGIVVFVLLLSLLPTRRSVIAIVAGVITAVTLLLLTGIEIELPFIGAVSVSLSYIEIPYLGSFKIRFHSLHGALPETLFTSLNWNLLWYLLIASFLLLAAGRKLLQVMTLDFWCAAIALLVLMFTFHMTYMYRYALDFTTLNRALMYPIPLLMFGAFRILSRPP